MEIQLKPQINIVTQLQDFFSAFKGQDDIRKSIIMPINLVEKKLHQHYVSLKPMDITFEYYDAWDQIRQTVVTCQVASPVQLDRTIEVYNLDHNETMTLSLEQILTVSANAA